MACLACCNHAVKNQCTLKALLVHALLPATVRLALQEEQAALKAQRPDEAINSGMALRGGAERSRSAPTATSDKQSDDCSLLADVKQAAPDNPLPQQKSAAKPARDITLRLLKKMTRNLDWCDACTCHESAGQEF